MDKTTEFGTYVLIEKLLTPIARALPLASIFSTSTHVSLNVTESVTNKSPASFLGRSLFSRSSLSAKIHTVAVPTGPLPSYTTAKGQWTRY